jgi:acylphosphatase
VSSETRERTARRVTVHGGVQGVGFRYRCVQEAERVGVAGWVRNEPDGTVTVLVEGTADAVDEMVAWCRQGPAHARVERVEAEPVAPTGARTFTVR